MKKLFVLLAVASLGFVACNNSSSDDEAKRIADSTHTADSLAKVQATADSLAKAQQMAAQDTAHKTDTTKSKMAPKK